MSPDVLLECPRTSFRDVLRVNVTERVWHSPPSALTVSKCENFGPIFPILKWENKSKYVNSFLKSHNTLTMGGGVNPYG